MSRPFLAGLYRAAIRPSLFVAGILLPCSCALGASEAKHLLLDCRVVDETDHIRLALGTVKKDPHNPLFVEEKPWEVRFDNLYANVVFDADEERYKCWYSPFIIDPATSRTGEQERRSISYREALSRRGGR
ncbi:MAG: hypothetical protein HUU20_26855, partial [Pirellulales bacterium]|nr:hypothetical protein [Pirellulales bacterium]